LLARGFDIFPLAKNARLLNLGYQFSPEKSLLQKYKASYGNKNRKKFSKSNCECTSHAQKSLYEPINPKKVRRDKEMFIPTLVMLSLYEKKTIYSL